MPIPPPAMSHAEKMARASAKRTLILNFLASGEVYTTCAIAAQVMACSISSAERTLASMVMASELKTESHFIGSRKTFVYGISNHGLALADQFDNPTFEPGRTNSAYIHHHLQGQLARLQAEAAGWSGWRPGKILYNQGLKKVPDALCTSPSGVVVALENELSIKSRKRLEEIIAAHLQAVSKSIYREVHYLTPPNLKEPLKNAFGRIETVPIQSTRVQLTQAHRDCFKVFTLEEWPPSQ